MFNEGCERTDILSEIEVELYGFPEVVLNQKSFVRVSTNLIQLLKSPFCHFTWSFSSPISAQNHWIAIVNMRLCSQVSDGHKPWGSWGIKLNNSNQALHPNRLHSDSKPSWPFEAITVVGVRSDVCLFFSVSLYDRDIKITKVRLKWEEKRPFFISSSCLTFSQSNCYEL